MTTSPTPLSFGNMELLPETRHLLREVHRVSGTPVLVKCDRRVQGHALLSIADSRNSIAHVITFDPMSRRHVDYEISSHCAKLLRFFSNPPEERCLLYPIPHFLEEMQEAAIKDIKWLFFFGKGQTYRKSWWREKHMRATLLEEFYRPAEQLAQEMFPPLYFVPVGLRADDWLMENYPDLAVFRYFSVIDELSSPRVIAPVVDLRSVPGKFHQPLRTLNATHALLWSQRLNRPDAIGMYSIEEEATARKLIDIFRRIPPDPCYDGELVDRWSRVLGVMGWRQWESYPCARPRPFDPSRWPYWLRVRTQYGSWCLELADTATDR